MYTFVRFEFVTANLKITDPVKDRNNGLVLLYIGVALPKEPN
jgi:hypothetical protein